MEVKDIIQKEEEFFNQFDRMGVPRGGLTLADSEELDSLVRKLQKENLTIADVGCWTGQSTAILTNIVKQLKGKVYAIDWFQGSETTNLDEPAQYFNIKRIFEENMRSMNSSNNVELINKKSKDAVNDFADNSLDVVFLDADHRYEYIKEDIKLWLPKVKPTGLLCGHDCEVVVKDGVNSLLDMYKDEDTIKVLHLGVCVAVGELGGRKTKMLDKFSPKETTITSVWYFVKG